MTPIDFKRLATDFRFEMIGNNSSKDMCYALSQPFLAYLISIGDYSFDLIESDVPVKNSVVGHVFLKQKPSQKVLDLTADQFNDDLNIDCVPCYFGNQIDVIHSMKTQAKIDDDVLGAFIDICSKTKDRFNGKLPLKEYCRLVKNIYLLTDFYKDLEFKQRFV